MNYQIKLWLELWDSTFKMIILVKILTGYLIILTYQVKFCNFDLVSLFFIFFMHNFECFFSFHGRNGPPYLPDHSGRGKHRQTEEQPMTVTTKKQAQHDIGTTRSVLHAFSWSVHLVPPINSLLSSPTTDAQTLQIHSYPWMEIKLVPFLDLGIKVKQESLISKTKQCWLCIWLFRVNLNEGSSS